jgi:hypothetical protein
MERDKRQPARFGMGFHLPGPLLDLELPNPNTLYGGGGGCSWIFIDMDARTTFAYVANKTDRYPLGDPRLIRAIRAFWQSLGIRANGAAGSLAGAELVAAKR